MILAVTDTETTGMGDTDQVLELAVVALFDEETAKHWATINGESRWSTLIRPTVPEFGQKFPEAVELSYRYGEPRDHVFAAHNAEFDLRMLTQSGAGEFLPKKVICTWRCAKHLWPEAPSHKNQTLRYWLDLDVPQIKSLPPHRALPDALVTAAILKKMLETHTAEQLVALTPTPFLLATCTMGENAGRPWSEVDSGFLRWVLGKGPRRPVPGRRDTGFDEDTLHTCRHWLAQRAKL